MRMGKLGKGWERVMVGEILLIYGRILEMHY